MGQTKTYILMAALTALLMLVGQAVGGNTGMLIAFAFAGFSNFFAYWNSDKIVLSSVKASEVDAQSAPTLYKMVEDLAYNADIPMPRVYIVPSKQPNAFATGRDPNHAAVAVNVGLMEMLNQDELAGVIAHELAHIKNRDTLTMTVTSTMAGALTVLARFAMFAPRSNNRNANPIVGLLLVILAPLAAAMIQFAVSRTREYEADRHGAWICGNPLWLADALEKLGRGVSHIHNEVAERRPEMASLYIVNPLRGGSGDKLFSTHPSLENRIQRLHELAHNDMKEAEELFGAVPKERKQRAHY